MAFQYAVAPQIAIGHVADKALDSVCNSLNADEAGALSIGIVRSPLLIDLVMTRFGSGLLIIY